MIIDLSMTPRSTIRLIVTRDRSFFKLATIESPMPPASGTRQRPPRQRLRSDALKGKAGHIRTIPMPAWVKSVLNQWLPTANITSGQLFRRVHKMGKTWGERLTEKSL